MYITQEGEGRDGVSRMCTEYGRSQPLYSKLKNGIYGMVLAGPGAEVARWTGPFEIT